METDRGNTLPISILKNVPNLSLRRFIDTNGIKKLITVIHSVVSNRSTRISEMDRLQKIRMAMLDFRKDNDAFA